MTWLFPYQESKYRQTRARLVDRLFGIEYTRFENQQIQAFDAAKKTLLVDITGFVSWIDKKQFLLLPTKTTAYPNMICQTKESVKFPDDNQYVSLKGKWQYVLESKKTGFAHKILMVENIGASRPDFGLVSPDITKRDFEQHLFDGWINIDEVTQNFIAQSFVSSPTTSRRVGGLTTSLFNPPRQQITVNLLYSDLKRLIAPELYESKSGVFDVFELGIKHTLPPFNWSAKASDFDQLSNTVSSLLERIPHSNLEYSISLLSRASAPDNLGSKGLVKSDYPIVLEEHVERKRNRYYTTPEVTKYLIAVQMSSPTVSMEVHERSIEYASKELEKLAETKEYVTKFIGSNRFLDLGVDGKPLSVLNLAISRARSIISKNIVLEDCKETTTDYIDNLNRIFDVWHDLGVGKMHTLNTLSLEEQRIWAFLDNNGPHNTLEISDKLKIDYDDCVRILNSLSYKSAVFLDKDGKYHAVPLK